MSKLCIAWKVNHGRGFSSPKENTPEVRSTLERWVEELKRAWPHGEFSVTEYPYARTTYMAGNIATMIARQPAGQS